ncbi:hypothetical protein [Pseudobutyrivibrio ruminis]|uniref:hypothetical protein n=1 Tax=Pseudobutyrivibrio ruminis TaxID=46206 RepID=UPI0016707872|nr:hypothetical protein [Pseudobutyrivibrio ruminis]
MCKLRKELLIGKVTGGVFTKYVNTKKRYLRKEDYSMLFKSNNVIAPGCVSAGVYVCVSYGKNF